MSGPYWWALAVLGLIGVVALPLRRLVVRTARSGRADGDEALVDWIVALREAGDTPMAQAVVRPAERECAVRQRAVVRAATAGPAAVSRPPQWRGSRRPPTSGRTPPALTGSDQRPAAPTIGAVEARFRPVSSASARLDTTERPRRSGWQRRNLLLLVLLGAGISSLLAGPVAAVACGGYGALGVRAFHRHGAAVVRVRTRRERLDQLCALAADLRAGLPVPVAAEALGLARAVPTAPRELAVSATGSAARSLRPSGAGGALPDEAQPESGEMSGPGRSVAAPDRPGQLAQAAVRLADRTGAPLADLIERIEADARSADRGMAAAAAQAAGARATAWLLAALPLGGIGLGYGIGVDPLQVLLHTPIGGGCAVAAIALQVVGLLWADRLGTVADGAS